MTRKIAIIGCGYVGAALGQTLVDGGHDVVGTTTSPDRAAELAAMGISHRVAIADDRPGMAELLADRDAVYITLAAGRRGRSYREVYLAAAESLAAALPTTAVRRVIYTSSTSVYGQRSGEWVDESSPANPTSENGEVLLAAERALLGTGGEASGPGRPAVSVVRLSGIYGPGRDPADFVARSAGATRTDGDAWLNLVHLDDIVTALHHLLDTDHHGVLCLSDDQPMRRRAFYDPLLADRGLAAVKWEADPSAGVGKRVRNAAIKAFLGMELQHPTHGRAAQR